MGNLAHVKRSNKRRMEAEARRGRTVRTTVRSAKRRQQATKEAYASARTSARDYDEREPFQTRSECNGPGVSRFFSAFPAPLPLVQRSLTPVKREKQLTVALQCVPDDASN